jgi:peptidoglycan/LPS O-acetylase OafA/YrhL
MGIVSADTLPGQLTAPSTPTAAAPKSRAPRLNTLTGMRFFAALAVVLCHVGGQFTGSQSLTVLTSYGYIGVSFFFMLSGFVLTWSSKRGSGNGRRFLWMRFCRVWPLQFLLIIVAFTALAAQEVLPGTVGRISEVLLLQAWSPQQVVYFGGNGVSWSLSCVMVPLVAPLLDRLRGKGLTVTAGVTLAVLAIAPLIAAGLHVSADLSYWLFFIFPPYRFGEFLLGMVLARAVRLGLRLPKVGRASFGVVAGLGIVLLVLTAFTLQTGTPVARPLVALLVLPLFAVLLLGGATVDLAGRRTWLNRSVPVRLGEWSFALYLVHKPLFLLTASWGWWGTGGLSGLTGLAGFAGFLALALALAGFCHHVAEKPIERYLRRWPIGLQRSMAT